MSDSRGTSEPEETSAATAGADQRPGDVTSTSTPTTEKKPRTPEQLERRKLVLRFAVFLIVGAISTVLLYFLLSALIPRWWSQLIGRQVSGRLSNGILLGLIYGFVFSFLPLIVLAQVRHRAYGWPAKGIIAVVAAVLTAPNLMTLGIAIGTSPAALTGDQIMDVTAPGFRYASLWGVVLGTLSALITIAVTILWERRSRELTLLRARVAQLEKERPSGLP